MKRASKAMHLGPITIIGMYYNPKAKIYINIIMINSDFSYIFYNLSLNNNRQLLACKFVENVVTILIDNKEIIYLTQ